MRVTLTLTIFLSCLILSYADDEDFAFESSDDVDAQLQNFGTNWNAPYQSFNAPSGKVFHLVVPKNIFGKDTTKFEVSFTCIFIY